MNVHGHRAGSFVPAISLVAAAIMALGATLVSGDFHTARAADAKSPKPASGETPKLFTAAQAKAGEAEYQAHCTLCHGANMEGKVGPTLKGPYFASERNGFTVAKIFSYVAYQMPGGTPGSLTHDQYVKIMARILEANGYPAGDRPLTFEGALRSEVPLISKVEEHKGGGEFSHIGSF